ncbi:MAG: MMPL family transporter [Polyangiaceae bacterium]|nr:MMPL family transporter [Polyangiaceae bacterium]
MRRYLVLALFVCALGTMVLFIVSRFAVTTNMIDFVPAGDDQKLYQVGKQLADSPLTRSMILSVGPRAGAESRVAPAAAFLASTLRKTPGISALRSGVAQDTQRAFYELYFSRRFQLLPAGDEPGAMDFSDSSLRQLAEQLKSRLAGAESFLIRKIATRDPWLLFPKLVDRLENSQHSQLSLRNGQLMSPDGHAMLFLSLEDSAFDSRAQSPVVKAVNGAAVEASARYGVTVEQSGANRFAVTAEQKIRQDVQRVSVCSALAVVLLFLLLFRSLRYLLFACLPLLAAFTSAVTVSLVLFGQLHAITLTFGSALIGVCIDYPLHLLNHHSASAPSHAKRSASTLRLGLGLACATTVAGLVGLGFAPFPGIRQIAVFSVVGVTAALLTTLWVLPPLIGDWRPTAPWLAPLSAHFARLVTGLRNRRQVAAFLPVLALVIVIAGWARLTWDDQLRHLTPLDRQLQAENDRVRARVSSVEMGKFIVVLAPDAESALIENDRVARLLDGAVAEHSLSGFHSLNQWLPSRKTQLATHARVTERPQLAAATRAALESAGFDAAAFSEIATELSRAPKPLEWSELRASPLGEWVSAFVTELDGEVAVITFLRGVQDPAALRQLLAPLPQAHYFDQSAMLNDSYRDFRQQTLGLVVLGLLLVVALVVARYRRVRASVVALAPALLAGATTVGLLSLLGQSLNLLHILSLLLVLSMGVDYGVFLAEAGDDEHAAVTQLSLLAACLTTLCSFGALALSDVPALQAMGLTVAIGVVLALLLAPVVVILAEGSQES